MASMTFRTTRARKLRTFPMLPLMLGALAGQESLGQTDAGGDVIDELRELPNLIGGEPGETEQAATAAAPVTRLETLLEVNRLADAGRPEDAQPLLEQLLSMTEEE